MMLTCSAFRCSVFDGSTISGTSGDPGADDPPASECIPDSVLYVTVDDEAFARMGRDLEHPAHFPLDAPGDVGPLGGGKLDLREESAPDVDRKSTRLNSSHRCTSYAVFCLKKKNHQKLLTRRLA